LSWRAIQKTVSTMLSTILQALVFLTGTPRKMRPDLKPEGLGIFPYFYKRLKLVRILVPLVPRLVRNQEQAVISSDICDFWSPAKGREWPGDCESERLIWAW